MPDISKEEQFYVETGLIEVSVDGEAAFIRGIAITGIVPRPDNTTCILIGDRVVICAESAEAIASKLLLSHELGCHCPACRQKTEAARD